MAIMCLLELFDAKCYLETWSYLTHNNISKIL
jgi:hypothetical protein